MEGAEPAPATQAALGQVDGQDWVAVGALSLLLTDIMLGVAWSHLGRFSYLGSSGMTWHALLVFLIVPMIVWHLARYRKLLRPRYWAERRSVLRLGGLAFAGAMLWQIGTRLDGVTGIAQAKRFTGSYAAGDFTGNGFPTTSWLNDSLEPIDREAWTLTIAGAVDAPQTVRYHELSATEEETAVLDCTGGWHSTQSWQGVRLGTLLERSRPQTAAASVTVTSATGYYRRFGLRHAEGLLLATHVGGERLSHGHGARCGWWCLGSAASSG